MAENEKTKLERASEVLNALADDLMLDFDVSHKTHQMHYGVTILESGKGLTRLTCQVSIVKKENEN